MPSHRIPRDSKKRGADEARACDPEGFFYPQTLANFRGGDVRILATDRGLWEGQQKEGTRRAQEVGTLR